MYYTYWGLEKPPFDNVPDPSMYVESHSSVENTVAETLFAIEEGNECVAVIVGDIGSGKTLSLRLILDSLDPDKYRIAFITNPEEEARLKSAAYQEKIAEAVVTGVKRYFARNPPVTRTPRMAEARFGDSRKH